MRVGDTSVLEGATPRSDEAFQRLLLQFSAAAARGTDAPALIELFCRATREFFQVDGTYFWRRVSSDEMVGTEADGDGSQHQGEKRMDLKPRDEHHERDDREQGEQKQAGVVAHSWSAKRRVRAFQTEREERADSAVRAPMVAPRSASALVRFRFNCGWG